MSFFEQQEQRVNKQFISIFDSVYFVSEYGKGSLHQAYDFIVGSLLRKQTYLLLITPLQVKTVYVCSEVEQSQYKPYITFETIIYELKQCIDHEGIGTGNPIYNLGFAKKRFIEQLVHLGMMLDEQVIFDTESPDITSVEYTNESDEWAFYQGLPREYDTLRNEYEALKQKYQELYNKKGMPEHYLKFQLELAKGKTEKAKEANARADQAERNLKMLELELKQLQEKSKAEQKRLKAVIRLQEHRLTNNNHSLSKSSSDPAPLYDWQSMNDYVYPPELQLALVIWHRIYQDNEIQNKHITSHSGKFKKIAKLINLNPDSTLGKRVEMVCNPLKGKKSQTKLIKQFKEIEGLFIPEDY